MLCRKICLGVTSVLLAVACGKSTTDSDGSAIGMGGTWSDDSGGAAGVGGGGGPTGTSGATTSTDIGGEGSMAATDGGSGGTEGGDVYSTASSGNEAGTNAGGGNAGVTAEVMGCVVAGARPCSSLSETSFACPRDAPVPETCSECYDPMVDEQGHPYNQCSTALPGGERCRYCCCEPSHSGCEERPELGCDWSPQSPRYFYCVKPYDAPPGCTLGGGISDLVDYYCCP